MFIIYSYIGCYNDTVQVNNSNTSLSLQTPAVSFTIENENVSMLQYNNKSLNHVIYRLKHTLAS